MTTSEIGQAAAQGETITGQIIQYFLDAGYLVSAYKDTRLGMLYIRVSILICPGDQVGIDWQITHADLDRLAADPDANLYRDLCEEKLYALRQAIRAAADAAADHYKGSSVLEVGS